MNRTRVTVAKGDISQVEADALITVINPSGMWFGGIDSVIMRHAGMMFHGQVPLGSLQSAQAIYAPATGAHQGKFKDVVFVIDDLVPSVDVLVLEGLKLASQQGLKHITVPTFRTGVMSGVRESRHEAVQNLAFGVANFVLLDESNQLETVTIVVYDSDEDVHLLKATLSDVLSTQFVSDLLRR